jgi:hypothetical protein
MGLVFRNCNGVRITLAGCCSGFCGVKPSFASNFPTVVATSVTPNFCLISLPAICRVHSPKSTPHWCRSLPLILQETCRSCTSVGVRNRLVALPAASARRPLPWSLAARSHGAAKPIRGNHRARVFALPHPLQRHATNLLQRPVIQRAAIAL